MPEKIFDDDTATVWCADALAHPELWESADVLVTDPPYGIGWKQGDTEKKLLRKSNAHAGILGDSDTAARDKVLEIWDGRRAVVFGSPMVPPPSGTKQALVFAKSSNSGFLGAIAGFRRDLEMIYLVGAWPSGIGGRSSIIRTRATTGSTSPQSRYGHPHAKPCDMLETLIGQLLRDDGPVTVADPFAGSGSVLVAARNLGHRGVGVEVDPAYAATAARRLAQACLPL